MTNRLTIHMNQKPIYDIVMETSFEKLPDELNKLGTETKRLCIVTDSTVADLYLKEVQMLAEQCCRECISFVFPAGEEYKNLDTVRELYEVLIQNHFDRKDMLLALGGGVVGDLCGFASATYLRGISFVQIPTTLLSQVDSSIGGKTGVDFDSYKNMVGAFHMPKLVYSNTAALLTLPDEQFSSGMGEIIKHGLIVNETYYRWLLEHAEEIWNRNLDICSQMILESDRIKKKVVEEDPTEQGVRALLNFGHTLGHAIEKEMHFKLVHGLCVGMGCLAAAYISAERGNITLDEVKQLRSILKQFHFPNKIQKIDMNKVIENTKNDKKMDGNTIKFILLNSVGEAYIDRTVTLEEMRHGLNYIMTEEQ